VVLPTQVEPSMNKAVVSAIMAMPLATGRFAFAQSYGDRSDRGRNEQGQRRGQTDRRDNEGRQPGRREDRSHANNNNIEPRDERGPGPNHAIPRGERELR